MSKFCDGASSRVPCPHPDDCTISCQFNDSTAMLAHQVKLIPLQEVHWSGIQTHLIWATWAFVAVILFTLVGAVSYIIGRLL